MIWEPRGPARSGALEDDSSIYAGRPFFTPAWGLEDANSNADRKTAVMMEPKRTLADADATPGRSRDR